MATSVRYFDLAREMKDAYNHCLRLVELVKKISIKPTARLFVTTVLTVRKWWRRYQQHGPSGLLPLSRARYRQPQKTPATTAAQLVELRKTPPTFGAHRLIREFDLSISHRALERIWRQHGLLKKRRRKYQKKQDLAHILSTTPPRTEGILGSEKRKGCKGAECMSRRGHPHRPQKELHFLPITRRFVACKCRQCSVLRFTTGN